MKRSLLLITFLVTMDQTSGTPGNDWLASEDRNNDIQDISPLLSYGRRDSAGKAIKWKESFDARQIAVLEKLNRSDRQHLLHLTALLVPSRWDLTELGYSPLPVFYKWAEPQRKIVLVDLTSQVFGAYSRGKLIHWGPVSSGRDASPTPAGLFHLNWKSRGRHSTDNPDWYMAWYFNFHNQRGVSFHQFSLPGHPASHSCVRLLERDAKWLFGWGEVWSLDEQGREVLEPGTPVLILGQYDFAAPPPWLKDRGPFSILLPDDPLHTGNDLE